MISFSSPHRTIGYMIAATIFVCGIIRFGRYQNEKKIAKAVRAHSQREAVREAQGITSDRLDNLWADADQYLWIQQGMIRKSASVPIRVDGLISRMVVIANCGNLPCMVALYQPPGGQRVDGHMGNVYQLPLEHGFAMEVKHPVPGDWKIDIEARDEVQLAVRGQSAHLPISIEHVDLSSEIAPADTPASVKSLACCAAGVAARVVIGLRGPLLSGVTITLISVDGKPFQLLHADASQRTRRSAKGEYDYRYSGHFMFPEGPFRFILEGSEGGGGRFQRFYPELYETPSSRRE